MSGTKNQDVPISPPPEENTQKKLNVFASAFLQAMAKHEKF